MSSRFRSTVVTSRYWVNASVACILLLLPIFHIIKFDFTNNIYYTFGKETTWLDTTSIFLGFWAGSYVITLTADYIFGRLFCGWICTWGTLLKALRYSGDKIKRKKLSPLVTEVVTLGAAVLSTIGLLNWFVDLTIIAQPSHSSSIFMISLVVVTTALSFVMLRYLGLRFCQQFCPIGWYLGVLSQKQLLRIDFEPANCTLGEVCVKDCPMAMDPRLLATNGEVNTHSQCVLCFDCISSCNACAAKVPGTKPLTIGTGVAASLTMDLEQELQIMKVQKDQRLLEKRAASKKTLQSAYAPEKVSRLL